MSNGLSDYVKLYHKAFTNESVVALKDKTDIVYVLVSLSGVAFVPEGAFEHFNNVEFIKFRSE